MARGLPKPWKRMKKNGGFDWYVTISRGRKQKQVYLAPQDTADEELLRVLLHTLGEENVHDPDAEHGFVAAKNQYLDHVQADQSPKTYRVRSSFLGSFEDYLRAAGQDTILCKDLKPFHVTAWLQQHPTWAPNTHRMALLSLKTCVNWAYDQGLLKARLLDRLKPPPAVSRGLEVVLAPEHRRLLIENCRHDCQKYVLFALYASGCRPGELCGLRAEDVALDQKPPVWRVRGKATKANPSGVRTVALNPDLAALTKRLLGLHPEGSLFRNKRGKAWTPGLIHDFVYRLRKRLVKKGHELPAKVIPYGLRHSFATDLIQGGALDYDVAKLMGHAGTHMVHQVYAKHDVAAASRALDHLRGTADDLRALSDARSDAASS
jgi:integrase/recombinase XerD